MVITIPSSITEVLYEGPLTFDEMARHSPPPQEVAAWDQPHIIIGRPQWWPVADSYRMASPARLPTLNPCLRDRECFLVQFACAFRPGRDTRLDWARLSVRLRSNNQGASNPIARDLYPREVYEMRRNVQIAVASTLTFRETNARCGEGRLRLQYEELFPWTTAVGVKESHFSWDMETLHAPPLRGERRFHALVSCPRDAHGVRAVVEVVTDVVTPGGIFRAAVRQTDTEQLCCLICSSTGRTTQGRQESPMVADSPVMKALVQLTAGDQAFETGDYARSLMCFEAALALADQVPASHAWARAAFVAGCKAGLSGALGALGRAAESLRAAEEALVFYDRNGSMYPAERHRWFNAQCNKGAALAQLHRDEEALAALQEARRMAGDSPEAAQARAICDHNIQLATEALAASKRQRPWWKLW